MLRTAEFLDKAMRAEVAAQGAGTPELRASFAEIARAWRKLAESLYRAEPTPAEGRGPS